MPDGTRAALMEAIARAKRLHALAAEVTGEVARAEAQWPPMKSAHEAYAVLLEEVDELWDHVKTNQKKRDIPAMRAEAIQVAAMAVRFIRDVSDGGRARS
jgi:NTP pyrophosphatase (non-canonical NTP hydrolase)